MRDRTSRDPAFPPILASLFWFPLSNFWSFKHAFGGFFRYHSDTGRSIAPDYLFIFPLLWGSCQRRSQRVDKVDSRAVPALFPAIKQAANHTRSRWLHGPMIQRPNFVVNYKSPTPDHFFCKSKVTMFAMFQTKLHFANALSIHY
jgi:hypothetical protein